MLEGITVGLLKLLDLLLDCCLRRPNWIHCTIKIVNRKKVNPPNNEPTDIWAMPAASRGGIMRSFLENDLAKPGRH